MPQWLTSLLHKPESQSSDPQHTCKKLSKLPVVIPVLGDRERGLLELAGQLAWQSVSSRFKERLCFKKQGGERERKTSNVDL